MPSRRRNLVDPLQLKPGDFVVHEQHGVGRFVEMVQRTVAGRDPRVPRHRVRRRPSAASRATGSSCPTDQLDQVTRYVGGEAPDPQQAGRRATGPRPRAGPARRRQADRRRADPALLARGWPPPGHAFGPDTPWQRELEDAFAYVETPDQLARIDEVKADMERPVPMDRLICGDVGYGKTEIAVRAAFKAVQDGKQVAVLVPTTLLVQQHLQTFAERYAQFPVTVKALSPVPDRQGGRARSSRAWPTARVDVVIGTHRLLSGEVAVQGPRAGRRRRGAAVRRRAQGAAQDAAHRRRRARDVARPRSRARSRWRSPASARCPRSQRRPRSGTRSSPSSAPTTRSRSPRRSGASCCARARSSSSTTRCRVDRAGRRAGCASSCPRRGSPSAHGQMGEHKLEQVVVDFWEKKFDVLVCTTIVETGLDISNANTLIVERADVLGLSPAAPAARPGRPRPRAGLRLLPLPAREAADRDGARPAADHRQPHRPRRRHAGRDEGPRDPRRRQPARRRAVRPHRRRRLRPLRPAGRRGRRRLPRRRRRRRRPRSRSSCRSTPTCRTTTCRGSGCGSRPTRSSPPSPTRPALAEIEAELVDRYGAAARAGREPLEVARLRTVRPAGRGRPTSRCRASTCGSARSSCASRAAAAAAAALPGVARQGRGPYDPGAEADDGAGRRPAAARHGSLAVGQRPHPMPSCWAASPTPPGSAPDRRTAREPDERQT